MVRCAKRTSCRQVPCLFLLAMGRGEADSQAPHASLEPLAVSTPDNSRACDRAGTPIHERFDGRLLLHGLLRAARQLATLLSTLAFGLDEADTEVVQASLEALAAFARFHRRLDGRRRAWRAAGYRHVHLLCL